MAGKQNQNDEPGNGERSKSSTPEAREGMTNREILLFTILRHHHPHGLTDEEWAKFEPVRGRDVSAAQQFYGELQEHHAFSTKDFVRRPVQIKRRNRGGKLPNPTPHNPNPQPIQQAAPVIPDDDYDLDDGGDAPALQFPRPSETRPGAARGQRQRLPRGSAATARPLSAPPARPIRPARPARSVHPAPPNGDSRQNGEENQPEEEG
ncbi:hypothetical protein PG984_011656 [Apiospora sp. TS-2023a]